MEAALECSKTQTLRVIIAAEWSHGLQLLGCLAGVEMILKDVGYPVKLGSGVAAACAYLQNSTPLIASRM
ncbi:hypothetical protein OIU74_001606 [Salix koriyanagi]|uniref:Uncharacterized protein n=1 Tax=Salix koriyanagi TaxID=2511006 RepID=A0A9Q0X5B6_9ROSI|nr:hypothetical protein OIU74_001606 [Salix koriyanagi]